LEQIIEEEQHGGPARSGLNYSVNHKLMGMKIFRWYNHAGATPVQQQPALGCSCTPPGGHPNKEN